MGGFQQGFVLAALLSGLPWSIEDTFTGEGVSTGAGYVDGLAGLDSACTTLWQSA